MCRTHGNYLGGNNWSMRSEVKKTLRLKVGSVYHNLAVNVLTFKIHTVLQVLSYTNLLLLPPLIFVFFATTCYGS